jgi:hypothetical protein
MRTESMSGLPMLITLTGENEKSPLDTVPGKRKIYTMEDGRLFSFGEPEAMAGAGQNFLFLAAGGAILYFLVKTKILKI